MKKSILTFLTVLIIFGSMSSSASDGMIQTAHSESRAAVVAADNPPAKEAASSTAMPGSAVILLIATGLVGLAGVSRRNNP
jgi:hypothetical protein